MVETMVDQKADSMVEQMEYYSVFLMADKMVVPTVDQMVKH